jgi:hypothetical protein
MRIVCFIIILSICTFSTIQAQGISIPTGAYLFQKDGRLVFKNNFDNNGVYIQEAGAIVFNGAVQYIKGASASHFRNILIQNGSNTTIQSPSAYIHSILKVDGDLFVNNNLTLLANTNQTAVIDGAGVGNIHGSLTAEAYFQNGIGYKYLGTPFQNSIVSHFSPWVNIYSNFPSVFLNDENVLSNGWVAYTNPDNSLTPMQGYAFQFGNSLTPKTISLNGIVNNGDYNLAIQNHNNPYTKGFHLISNPYPSPIDWDAQGGWTKTNIDNAIYYFDADSTDIYGGVYNTYINGVSSNGIANNLIPSFQGFFVHVTDGTYPVSGTIGVNNAARVVPFGAKYRKVNSTSLNSFIRLSLSSKISRKKDFAVVYFTQMNPNSTAQLDATKLLNTSLGYPNLYFMLKNKQLAIQGIHQLDSVMHIPIEVSVNDNGSYIFDHQIVNNISTLDCFYYLVDHVQNKTIALNTTPEYEVYLNNGTTKSRFELVLSNQPLVQKFAEDVNAKDAIFSVFNKQGHIYIHKNNSELSSIVISNVLGEKIYDRTFQVSGIYELDIPHVAGTYFVSYQNEKGIYTKKIIIAE